MIFEKQNLMIGVTLFANPETNEIYIYIYRKFFNSHLFWLNSHPFFARSIICRLNLDASVGVYGQSGHSLRTCPQK